MAWLLRRTAVYRPTISIAFWGVAPPIAVSPSITTHKDAFYPIACLRFFFRKMASEQNGIVLPPLADKASVTYVQPIATNSAGGRVRIAALMSSCESDSFIGKHVTVCGWSRSVRKQGGGSLCFVVLSDGSSAANLQVVVESTVENFDQVLKCGAGCSFKFSGLVVESPAKGQKVELQVKDPKRGK